ncbi:MAG: hypothetical protein K6C12_05705 [Oscillospiraceae bacterium]|nr:hypothetical protein [Oscillospiraceae bacterium]
MEQHWGMIWHQAMTRSFLKGKAFGRNKTVVFTLSAPVSGDNLRIRCQGRQIPADAFDLGKLTGKEA